MTDEQQDAIEGYADGMGDNYQPLRTLAYRRGLQDAEADIFLLDAVAEYRARLAMPEKT